MVIDELLIGDFYKKAKAHQDEVIDNYVNIVSTLKDEIAVHEQKEQELTNQIDLHTEHEAYQDGLLQEQKKETKKNGTRNFLKGLKVGVPVGALLILLL